MKTLEVKIKGTAPLLMHNPVSANPLSPQYKALKEITSRRKKTDDDHEQIAKIEWRNALYWDKETGPYIPGINLESMIHAAAAKQRLKKDFLASVVVMEDKVELDYKGPKEPEKLQKDPEFVDVRFVTVNRAKIMRCRPKFLEWGMTFNVAFDETQINQGQLETALQTAGKLIGVGDYRPRFGRFNVEKMK